MFALRKRAVALIHLEGYVADSILTADRPCSCALPCATASVQGSGFPPRCKCLRFDENGSLFSGVDRNAAMPKEKKSTGQARCKPWSNLASERVAYAQVKSGGRLVRSGDRAV